MSTPDPADVLVAGAADRLALISIRDDAGEALKLCKELHKHRADVRIALRYDMTSAPDRKRAPIVAKWPGRCAACAGNVSVGDQIYYDSGKAVHARCA